jgi:hypothetical protein
MATILDPFLSPIPRRRRFSCLLFTSERTVPLPSRFIFVISEVHEVTTMKLTVAAFVCACLFVAVSVAVPLASHTPEHKHDEHAEMAKTDEHVKHGMMEKKGSYNTYP